MTVIQQWDSWHYGCIRAIVRYLLTTRPYTQLRKAKFVMDRLLAHVAVEERVRVHKLPPAKADELFSVAYSACVGVDISTMQGGS